MARIIVLGASGSGKSWYAGYLMERILEDGNDEGETFDFAAHLDYKDEELGLSATDLDEYDSLYTTIKVDPDTYENANWLRVLYRHGQIRLVPVDLTLDQIRDLYGIIAKAAMKLGREGAGSVFVSCDEAHHVVPQVNNMDERVETLLTTGRGFGVESLHITQRPALIHKTILSQCDKGVYFRMGEENDVKKIRGSVGFRADQLLEFPSRKAVVENKESGDHTVIDTNEYSRRRPHYSGDDGIADDAFPV